MLYRTYHISIYIISADVFWYHICILPMRPRDVPFGRSLWSTRGRIPRMSQVGFHLLSHWNRWPLGPPPIIVVDSPSASLLVASTHRPFWGIVQNRWCTGGTSQPLPLVGWERSVNILNVHEIHGKERPKKHGFDPLPISLTLWNTGVGHTKPLPKRRSVWRVYWVRLDVGHV